jgi:hypothetical protein
MSNGRSALLEADDPGVAGKHNAQNHEIVAYSDYRLQARQRCKRRRNFGFNK